MSLNFKPLSKWFQKNKRSLPWREDPTPYKVWISEIMLQQTQVKTVIPYFERWIQRFPDIKKLAKTPVDEIIKIWEGLGYYSRARFIHESAVKLHQEGHDSITNENMILIKGLGPYTKGAIKSFAFKEKAAAVDGNVLRVMSRLTLFEEDISKMTSRKEIEARVFNCLPDEKPWEAMEALIELGAQICKKNPHCTECPMVNQCLGFQKNRHTLLPIKKKAPPITKLKRVVLVLKWQDRFLVKKAEKGRIMADLYEFWWEEADTIDLYLQGLSYEKLVPLANVKHGFTQYEATLIPYLIELKDPLTKLGYNWITFEDLKKLPFAGGHREVLNSLHKV
jgi:A/G-specific adenine glycosylase